VLSDNYFTMRYRPKTVGGVTANVAGTGWSRWMPAKLVEGWIKRVLAGINPFNQRVSDLYNNAVNTDVSLLTQAGTRWEGNVALSLSSINDFGLIEIYETVLNRGKNISIEAGYDYAPANDALLLAAGYLNDLYTILGNEAYADAANPTISVDGSSSATEVNTSRFSFEGQVKSVLEEELALLRGRDDFLSPSVGTAPAYNRLYWNYTRGINSGEALYATNYNIAEKAGSPTANGTLDAADAQRMFPQGHGDAYGHYLTALKGYQRLLRSPHFSWTPRSEAVTVLGQAIQIDYFDERKFAGAAANVARSAQQILALTHRQSYQDDPAAGWSHFRDGKYNSATNTTRHWGLDEWTSRASQGSYYNWIVGNALLLPTDTNPTHTGVQIIDRTTVPELKELTALANEFQTRIDNANAHLNPLGLSPGAIAFDISASELKGGKSHYEQIYERSLRAALNAKGAFDQAARMTRLLRNQANQVSDRNDAIVDQEEAYVRRLIELYGTPYPGEIGVGKTLRPGLRRPRLARVVHRRPPDRCPRQLRAPHSLGEDSHRRQDVHRFRHRRYHGRLHRPNGDAHDRDAAEPLRAIFRPVAERHFDGTAFGHRHLAAGLARCRAGPRRPRRRQSRAQQPLRDLRTPPPVVSGNGRHPPEDVGARKSGLRRDRPPRPREGRAERRERWRCLRRQGHQGFGRGPLGIHAPRQRPRQRHDVHHPRLPQDRSAHGEQDSDGVEPGAEGFGHRHGDSPEQGT
jgi:hypothetical protein